MLRGALRSHRRNGLRAVERLQPGLPPSSAAGRKPHAGRPARRMKRIGVPYNEAFFYHPLFDWSYLLRLASVSRRRRIWSRQAAFLGYAKPCLWARRLFGGRPLLVERNVEYASVADQRPDTPEAARAWLKQTEVALSGGWLELAGHCASLPRPRALGWGGEPPPRRGGPVNLAATTTARKELLRQARRGTLRSDQHARPRCREMAR